MWSSQCVTVARKVRPDFFLLIFHLPPIRSRCQLQAGTDFSGRVRTAQSLNCAALTVAIRGNDRNRRRRAALFHGRANVPATTTCPSGAKGWSEGMHLLLERSGRNPGEEPLTVPSAAVSPLSPRTHQLKDEQGRTGPSLPTTTHPSWPSSACRILPHQSRSRHRDPCWSLPDPSVNHTVYCIHLPEEPIRAVLAAPASTPSARRRCSHCCQSETSLKT